ncbi:MAG: HAMP domain-containing histidine kinase [Planctomycetes bacterium]|nr:HAMP domain-containing histidine kinase [Planctomycetota bacterium]
MLSIREADPVKTAPKVVLMRGAKSPSTRRQQLVGNLAQQKGFYRNQRNVTESQKRMQTLNNSVRGNNFVNGFRRIGLKERVEVRPMKAIWAGDRLLLVRETRVDGKQYLQGCVLNWPAIRKWMTAEIDDLLPQARLLPQKSAKTRNSELMLASIPVKLVPGKTPVELLTEAPAVLSLSGWTPMRYSLLIAWVCIAMAAIAVAALLLATIRLSERRGTFVSAVTHELRTPLTTFRMYTDMLCSGIVTEKEQQQRYLNTLQVEADRLGHLVENVLSYARLESPKKRPVRETVCLGDVIRRLQDSLERRVHQAEMQLEITLGDDSELNVQTDAAAVERILSNLVDNACKYAASAEDCRIHVECAAVQQTVRLRVRDHGPGLNSAEEKRMFLPFSKSDSDAANSAPGVGLGLSLCRRLAKNMGGELRLDKSNTDGACFELTLPVK